VIVGGVDRHRQPKKLGDDFSVAFIYQLGGKSHGEPLFKYTSRN
jgi:hypothetical protein